ncbi:MAG: DUF805 domain-containing protein [bacterium]
MIDFLFNPNGRISRKGYWLGFLLPYVIISVLLEYQEAVGVPAGVAAIISAVVGLFYFWPSIAVPVKRFHDRNMTGWWVLIFSLIVIGLLAVAFASFVGRQEYLDLMAEVNSGNDAAAMQIMQMFFSSTLSTISIVVAIIVSLIQFIIIGFLPGTEGDNKYGTDPRINGGMGMGT